MNKRTMGQATLLAASVAMIGCSFVDPPPFEPKQIEKIQQEQASRTEPQAMRALPTTLQSLVPRPGETRQPTSATTRPYRADQPLGPAVRMTLQEIMHRAVANNHDVRVAGYEAAVDELRILEAEARFDPTVFSQFQVQRQFPQNGIGGILNPRELLTQTFQGGLRQSLESGGQVELRAQSSRNELPGNTRGDAFNPGGPDVTYQNELALQVTQPLLRNFGRDVNRARITIARNDQRITELDFRERLERTLQDIEEAYWTLQQAERNVEILENLLRQTDNTTDILVKRMAQDTNRVQVSQSQATAEARAADLVRARARLGDISDRLKRLMNDPDMPVVSPVVILPADQPLADPVVFQLADQIETALQNRTELLQQKLRIDSAGTVIGAAKNNLLPELNLQASAGVQGIGGGFDGAFRQQYDTDLFFYTVGFAFEVPIGNRQARAIYQRTLLSRLQAMEQYRGFVEQVAEEVKVAQRDVETSWNEMIATRHARFSAEDALDAIEQQERAGTALTPPFVQLKLDRQAALADALQSEAQAVRNYNVAISTLERAKGTILRYNNVVTKEAAGPVYLENQFGRQ